MAAAVVPIRIRRGIVHVKRASTTHASSVVGAGTDDQAGTKPQTRFIQPLILYFLARCFFFLA